MRELVRLGSSVLVVLMVLACVLLWIGVPVGWLWIGSQIQAATDNLGAAVGTMLFGAIVTIVLMMPVLSGLSNAYRRSRVARGLEDTGHFALETVLVLTAGVAVVAFCGWFFFLSGAQPVPFAPGR